MNIAQLLSPRIPPWDLLVRGVAGMFVTLVLALAGVPAHAAPPPAGTSISNQASATYSDGSGTARTVTSNQVLTTVTQVFSLTLASPGAQNATPGSVVYYPHTLTNTSNGPDTFNLAASSSGGSFTAGSVMIYADNGSGTPTGSPITSTGQVTPGSTFKFIVAATVPSTATSGQTNTLSVSASSLGDGTKSASNTDTTTVTANAVVTLTKAISASSGPSGGTGTYTYTLTYTNTGNSDATQVTLRDTIPSGMVYQTGQSRWSVTGAGVALNDSTTPTAVGSSPNTMTASFTAGVLTTVIERVAAGQSGFVTFQVKVGAAAPGVINNTADLSYNNGAATVNGTSNQVPFTVTQAAAVSMAGDTVAGPAAAGSTVTFTNVVTNGGNGSDTFNMTLVSNTFPIGTTFQFYKSDGSTPMVDTNGDGVLDTGPVAAGASYNVVVKATLPPNAPTSASAVNLVKRATSVFDAARTTTATDTLNAVTGASVDLMYQTNNGNGTGPEATARQSIGTNPGTTAVFTLLVKNTGQSPDTYDLAASTTSGTLATIALPTGWTVDFKADASSGACTTTGATVSNTGTIAAGASSTFCAVVTIPAGYVAGTLDMYFRALSPSSSAKDILHDAVTVNAVRSISIAPNGTGQTYPGGSYVYTHTVTNNGNVPEGSTFSTLSPDAANNIAGWTSTLYYDANNNGTLDATDPVVTTTLNAVLSGALVQGGSVTVFNKVIAPSGAVTGAINVTTVKVTTANGSYTNTAPAPSVSTDSTTVIAGNLTLLKEQVQDKDCNGAADASFAYGQGNLSLKPGECVLYRITVTNVGAADATNVIVSDATPSYTTVSTAAALASGTGQITGPAVNATGTINAYVGTGASSTTSTGGTLAAGQSAVITFGVKITP
jgi:uncharacterized repeat protein (TIGR01451 family)